MGKILKNKKGNALLAAVVTFSVLIILTMGIAASSVTSIQLSVKSARVNNTYYSGETAAQKGLQQVKESVAQYYAKLRDDFNATQDMNAYNEAYTSFFDNVIKNAEYDYKEPVFTETSYKGVKTTTTFSKESEDNEAGTAQIKVTSKATMPDGSEKTVSGYLTIQKYPVVTESGSTYEVTKNVLTVGGNMVFYNNNNTQQVNVSGGTIQIGGYQNKNAYKSLNPESAVSIVPGLGDAIKNELTYATMLQKRDTRTPTRYITATTPPIWSDQGSQSELHYLEGVDGLSFSVSGGSYYGQVYCRGSNLTIQNGNYFGNIFCDGNVTLNGASVNGNIVAAGDINISGGTYYGTIQNGKLVKGAFFAGGNININNGGTAQNLYLYARNNFNMNSNPSGSAIIFAGGDINVTVSRTFSYSGTMLAKGNFNLKAPDSCWHQLNNSPALAAAAPYHEWYNTFFSTKTTSYVELEDWQLNGMIKKEQIVGK